MKTTMKRLTAVFVALLVLCMGALPASAKLDTGHSIDVTFKVLYVDDSFSIGYNYGTSEKTTFVCQYTTNHSDTAYNNHTIAISDIKAAADRATVDKGYSIVGWSKEANADPKTWPLTMRGTTACNKGTTIYLVAKKPEPTAVPTTPTPKPTATPTPTPTAVPATATPEPTAVPATEVPPTDVPPTEVPPTDVPPTDVPPTDVPPTDVPPTDVPPTDVPPTDVPPTEVPPTWTPIEPQGNYVSVTGKTRTAGEESLVAKNGPMSPVIWYYPLPDDVEDMDYVIPELSELFELNEGWKLVGVSVDAKTTGMKQPGETIQLDAKGARLTYYFDRDKLPVDEPTATPTVKPTEEPTVAPTEEPTAAPTEEPTAAPTEEPTVAPTEEPTVAPTAEPTATPTAAPTVAPTKKPGNTDIPKTSDRTYPVQMALLLGGAFCLLIAAGTGIKSRKLRKNK